MERIKPNHTGLSRPAIARLARQHSLARTISLGTDSHDFERMLNYSMQCWYRAQPQGATNYINPNFPSEIPMELRKDIGIGEVSFSRENHSHLGKAGLVYTPSAFYHKKFSYSEKQISVIDLR